MLRTTFTCTLLVLCWGIAEIEAKRAKPTSSDIDIESQQHQSITVQCINNKCKTILCEEGVDCIAQALNRATSKKLSNYVGTQFVNGRNSIFNSMDTFVSVTPYENTDCKDFQCNVTVCTNNCHNVVYGSSSVNMNCIDNVCNVTTCKCKDCYGYRCKAVDVSPVLPKGFNVLPPEVTELLPSRFIAWLKGFEPLPAGFTALPQGFTAYPGGFTVLPEGYTALPAGFTFLPPNFIDKIWG